MFVGAVFGDKCIEIDDFDLDSVVTNESLPDLEDGFESKSDSDDDSMPDLRVPTYENDSSDEEEEEGVTWLTTTATVQVMKEFRH